MRPAAAEDQIAPAKLELQIRSRSPFNAEPKLPELTESYLTPVDRFFVRNHGNQPRLNAEAYELVVEGLVDEPRTFKLAELQERFARAHVLATVTCAGNRRTELSAVRPIAGVSWEAGAISNGEWSGVLLSDVLQACGVRDGARHVWFDGSDEIKAGKEIRSFGGSIPIDTAMAQDRLQPRAILADRMNGQPLTAEHGYPLRSLIPGYIGARSVKWLRRITVSDRPSTNFYLDKTYKLVDEITPEKVAAASPIYEYLTNSAIAEVCPAPQGLRVTGYALAGGARGNRIARVDLSTDAGRTWTPARIISPQHDFAWVLWSGELPTSPAGGEVAVTVRATDSSGYSQPEKSPWNAQGYQYNGWHHATYRPA